MKIFIFRTSSDWQPFILRLLLGFVIFPHGAQKLFGWFGGYGFSGTMNFFSEVMGLPWLVGFLVIILESVGAIALIAGIGTRILAISYTILAIGIIFSSHVQFGFFMNWFSAQNGEGYEFFLLWIAISLSLIVSGGGRFSFDRRILKEA